MKASFVLPALLAAGLSVTVRATAQTNVGIYLDPSGTTCTLSDPGPGTINAYVVVRHDPLSGVRGVRFSAPRPACFNATFVADLPVPGTAVLGESPTGVSIALPLCQATPAHVLTIQYFGNGTTPACCEFPVLADPNAGVDVLITDCSYNEIAATGVVSRINADASCPCTGNSAPLPPVYPSPPDLSTFESIDVDLGWSSIDPEGGSLEYDVYFGALSPAPLLATAVPVNTYDPGTLERGTQYHWRIVARDEQGAESSGPEWTFTTVDNYPPTIPSSPVPNNGAFISFVNVTVGWQCFDYDGDPLSYDIYFGTSSTPPLVAAGVATNSYDVGTLNYSTLYYWRVVAHDDHGGVTEGPVWRFTSGDPNVPPTVPANPVPAHGATAQSVNAVLSWQCTDPDADPLTFDVFFGTVPDPPALVIGQSAKSIQPPGPLAFSTTYYWHVIAHDADGAVTPGPAWSFTTSAYTAPGTPVPIAPANGGMVTTLTPVLSWAVTDADGQVLTHDVYFGTESDPPLVSPAQATKSYAPGVLTAGTRYYWRIVTSDGATPVSGPVWTFDVAPPGATGDANGDGIVDAQDADCALTTYMQLGTASCLAPNGAVAADVDCGGSVTPGDARCIHRTAIDGSCAFCAGGMAAAAATPTQAPYVFLLNRWTESGWLLHVVLGVTGRASLGAFGFRVNTTPGVYLFDAVRVGATGSFTAMARANHAFGGIVGAYNLADVPLAGPTQFIELRLAIFSYPWRIVIDTFVDDLAGAYPVVIDDSPPLPVLFSRFGATATDAGIEVNWELASDESMDSYTLLRRDGSAALPVEVARGSVERTTGAHLDRDVEAGREYHYELLVRTADGDEFRSPVATARTRELALALHQNQPNPFNPQTKIRYEIPSGGSRVRLAIYDLEGALVRTLVDQQQAGGVYAVDWNATDGGGSRVASGVYFYVLDTGRERLMKKLVLLK